MDKIQVCGVEIPVPEGTIGVSCSGGADSVALLYTLMHELPDKRINVYTAIENDLDFRILAGPAVSTILGKTIQRIGPRKIKHKIMYHNSETNDFPPEQLLKHPLDDLSNGHIVALYSGITATPPIDIARSFDDDPYMLEEVERRAPGQNLPTVMENGLYMPFRNHDKKIIAEIYQHYNLMDWLYPLTFSCEKTTNTFENPSHCGECWWCQEREWAFGRLV
jgi:hypothetical protein